MERKYCEDCRFCQVNASGIMYARCAEPRAGDNPDGSKYVARQFDQPRYASAIRSDHALCGPDAAWLQPKPANEAEAA